MHCFAGTESETQRKHLAGIVFYFFVLAILNCTIASAQSQLPPFLQVTPSARTTFLGQPVSFTVVDQSGVPLTNAEWSISSPIAELRLEDGQPQVFPREPGRAIISVRVGDATATATLTILPPDTHTPGTVVWSNLPTPGFATLESMPAMPAGNSEVAFYSVEWSQTQNALLRAFTESGEQVWMRQLSSNASPSTKRQEVRGQGELYFNGQMQSEHAQMLLGQDSTTYILNHGSNQAARGLPPDGKAIYLRCSGDSLGGILILERGRFRDMLVDIGSDGRERWRYRSEGRLNKNWTVNYQGDIGIVETLFKPASAALIVVNGATGQSSYKIAFPVSSSTVNGFRCKDPRHNVLFNLRPSVAGSVFTNSDGNMYVQVVTYIESTDVENCKSNQYATDNEILLLRLTPNGEPQWKSLVHLHADADGGLRAQPRIFAGESIPDGFGGVLAAWTMWYPDSKPGQPFHTEARLTRASPDKQREFTLPLIFWTPLLDDLFDENMVLGDGNLLYATNAPLLIRYDTEAGEVKWQRHPPTGKVKLHLATGGGGVLISNAGRLVHFDAAGNGVTFSWTTPIPNSDDVGLVQNDPVDNTPLPPLALRDLNFTWEREFIAVEDTPPLGRGSLVLFSPN